MFTTNKYKSPKDDKKSSAWAEVKLMRYLQAKYFWHRAINSLENLDIKKTLGERVVTLRKVRVAGEEKVKCDC